jgi:hypothetical protein
VVNDLPGRLETLLRQRAPGAAYLDLTPAFTEAARRGELVYLAYDPHWSAQGHRVAAAAIATALARASPDATDGPPEKAEAAADCGRRGTPGLDNLSAVHTAP